MALAQWPVQPDGLVHYSDRGVQYACGDYIARLERAGILPSMSRVACTWDNAMAESFMATLKREEADGRDYRDLADAPGADRHVNRADLQPAAATLGAGISLAGGV
jgi:transposase InsO family protein